MSSLIHASVLAKSIDNGGGNRPPRRNGFNRARICGFRREQNRIVAVLAESLSGPYEVPGSFFLASLPLTDLIEMMRPEAPVEVLRAARALRYRQHIGVNLVVEGNP